jgi:hypothetical protein
MIFGKQKFTDKARLILKQKNSIRIQAVYI